MLSFEAWVNGPRADSINQSSQTDSPAPGGVLLEPACQTQCSRPDVVFLTLGVWEAFTLDEYRKGRLFSPLTAAGARARHSYEARVNQTLALAAPLRDALALAGSALIVVSTPTCLKHQGTYFRHVFPPHWPTSSFEELVHLGNRMSAHWARREQGSQKTTLSLDAAKVVEAAPGMLHSPCMEHHPHGVLSDTIVRIVANALCP